MTSPLLEKPLVSQVAEVFRVMFAGARGDAVCSIGRGSAMRQALWPGPNMAAGLLPGWLLEELSHEAPDDLVVPLMSVPRMGQAEPLDVVAVWTEMAFAPVFEGYRWGVSADAHAVARERLDGWPCAPSFIVDGGDTWLVAWLLDGPAAVDKGPAYGRIWNLQHAVAQALGGRIDDVSVTAQQRSARPIGEPLAGRAMPAFEPQRPVLRLPGSRNTELRHDVNLVGADLARRYTLEQLETAAGVTRPNANTGTRTRP
jgi:hypothetical protein